MKIYGLITLLALAVAAAGRQEENNEPACDCPSCLEKAASGKEFSLPGLQGLAQEAGSAEHGENPERVSHAAHDHDEEERAAKPLPYDDRLHDHPVSGDHVNLDEHSAHDHEAEGIPLTRDMYDKTGIQVREAESGIISMTAVLPAEIKLNRDRTAAVSPRYASIVRRVFAEIGDEVKKGDILASLENRETMAVYTVAAPLDGVIIAKDTAVGETAEGEDVLYEVADLSSVWADISVFPRFRHTLRKGMQVTFIAHDGHTVQGTIQYISPIVSHETRTFTARCVLEGADEDFTPGAFVRARINLETVEAEVVVPRKAVQRIDGEPVLFVPGDDGFITTPVQTGRADEDSVEIIKGLARGERYVADGAFALKAETVTGGMDSHAGHGH